MSSPTTSAKTPSPKPSDKGTDTLDFSRVTSGLRFTFNADGSVEVVDQSNAANRVVATNVETIIGGSGNDVYRAVEGSRGTTI